MKRKKQAASSSEAEDTSRRRNRRQALALGGAAAAAAAVAAMGMDGGKKAHAATGDEMKVGQYNEASAGDPTTLSGDVDDGVSLRVENHGAGGAIQGESWMAGAPALHGIGNQGVHGVGRGSPDIGVWGESGIGPGVFGETKSDDPGQAGVRGHSLNPAPGGPLGGAAIGVEGISFDGLGVHGNSLHGPGVVGESETASGVAGHSQNGPGSGVRGVTTAQGSTVPPRPSRANFGVGGVSLKPGTDWRGQPVPSPSDLGNGVGVWGASGQGIGLQGVSESGIGVCGNSPGDVPAVLAFSGTIFADPRYPILDGGLALAVEGKAAFSTAGAGVVPPKAAAATVANPAVTGESHITVTFTGDPGNAAAVVQWVERQPGSGFIVHLRVPVSNETPFTYLIVEPSMGPPFP